MVGHDGARAGSALAFAAVLSVGLLGCAGTRQEAPEASAAPASPAAARIGVYDTRLVGLAFGRSAATAAAMADLRARHGKAREAGDAALAESLEEEGKSRQVRLHLQVFSNAPVEDAIAAVADRLPGVAAAAGVAAIVPSTDWVAPGTEVVDVTDALVALFDPTPETLNLVVLGRGTKPLPIERIARMPAEE